MNIGGFSGENTHGGDTQIFGSLTVDGQVIVRDAEGQSEYLDSGDYNPIVLGVATHWNSLILKTGTQARFAKNGNIVEVYMELTGNIKANQSFAQISISVPSVELFDKKHTGSAYSDSVFILAGNAQVYNCTDAFITTSGSGKTSVLLNYDSYIPTNPISIVDFFVNITYKLEGDDIPASAIIQGGGGSGGDVRNPMIEPLNGGGFDIVNVGNVQASTFNGGLILTNPLAVDLDANNNNIINSNTITTDTVNSLNVNGISGNSLFITNPDEPIVITGSKIEMRSNPPNTGKVEFYTSIDMDNKNIENVQNIITQRVLGKAGTPLIIDSAVGFDIELKDDTKIEGNLDMDGNIITAVTNIGSLGDLTILSAPTGLLTIGNVAQHKYTNIIPNNGLIEQYTMRMEEHTNVIDKVDTVHIYDASGFNESNINIGGVDYYSLNDNCTYIIHDQITLTKGFNYGINTAIKGESIACSITFDESTNDICGFRSDNQHLFLTDITIIGGGGHFTSSTANVKGLFDFSNFNTGAPAPFYGRNKRCRIQNVQIIAPYSLGKLQGGGTLRLLGNFLNGGGAQPTGIYTTVGLEVSDGLSFEFCNNKVVLMAGAQVASTLKMLDFVDATLTPVVLGFNAVIISGNIFHPRNQENAINFENNSITQLGTIGSNTFIRTGGTAPLINYERATINDNYNKSAIVNYEVNGNAGVLDVLPTCLVNGVVSNSLSSATYIDITFPFGNIQELNGTKRFGLKSFVSGVAGGNYTTGNYIRDTTNVNKFAYILDSQIVLGGTNKLILLDFNEFFNSATNYEEIDKDFVLTGVTSTAFIFGTLNNEIEIYYADKDPADLQIVTSISHNNSSTNDEVQFILAFDTGSGYVQDPITTVSVTNPRAAPRSNTSTITTLKRFKKGDLFKFLYRYVDTTTSIIDNITITVH
jgi:hypothetical protein